MRRTLLADTISPMDHLIMAALLVGLYVALTTLRRAIVSGQRERELQHPADAGARDGNHRAA